MPAAHPQHAIERARRLSGSHPDAVVAEITGMSVSALSRARRRGWRAGRAGYPQRPMPTDFAIQSRHMTADELRAHYRTSNRAVARWRRELAR